MERELPDRRLAEHRVACSTRIGRTHQKNQDTGGAWTWTSTDGLPVSLAIVADGVSAGVNSERASRLAVDAVRSAVADSVLKGSTGVDELLEIMSRAVRSASEKISGEVQDPGSTLNVTTVVAAICTGQDVAGVWCGDSRAYHLAGSGVTRLTRDHSWAEGVVSQGLMSDEQAARDPRAHMITRWLGPQEPTTPEIDTFRLRLQPGEMVLVCSDGLYAYFNPPDGREPELQHAFRDGIGLQSGMDELVATALHRGGHDDVTGAIIQLQPPS